MKIEILGMGCPKCKKLFEFAEAAANQSGVQIEIVKVDDISKIMDYRVMATPAIAIDGKIKASGRIPAPDEIMKWISAR